METKSLTSEISNAISELKFLKRQDPTNKKLKNEIKKLYAALKLAEDKEWEIHLEEYKKAKKALKKASVLAQEAIYDLSQTAKTIEKVTKAIDKVIKAIAFLL